MTYDVILTVLAAVFPMLSCALFIIFWKLSRDDSAPDPIYSRGGSHARSS